MHPYTLLHSDMITTCQGTLAATCSAACKQEYPWNIHFHQSCKQLCRNIVFLEWGRKTESFVNVSVVGLFHFIHSMSSDGHEAERRTDTLLVSACTWDLFKRRIKFASSSLALRRSDKAAFTPAVTHVTCESSRFTQTRLQNNFYNLRPQHLSTTVVP